jgi:hypothetical protein
MFPATIPIKHIMPELNKALQDDHDAWAWPGRSIINNEIVKRFMARIRERSTDTMASRDERGVTLYLRGPRGGPKAFRIDATKHSFMHRLGTFLGTDFFPLTYVSFRDDFRGWENSVPPGLFSAREMRLLLGGSWEVECPGIAKYGEEECQEMMRWLLRRFVGWQVEQSMWLSTWCETKAHLALACRRIVWEVTAMDQVLRPPGKEVKEFMAKRGQRRLPRKSA